MTALKVVIQVPEGEAFAAAVGTRISNQERPQLRYLQPGEQIELFIEEGAHLDIGRAKVVEPPCR